jgi:polysaccharide biosynthesis protein PslH
MWVSAWRAPAFAAALGQLARSWRPDVVQVEYHIMGQYLPVLGGQRAPRVLRQLEPGTATAGDRARGRRGAARLLAPLERRAWERYERWVMRQVQAVVALTAQDEEALRPIARAARIVRIPLGIPIPLQALDPVGLSVPSALFVGSFSHPPNADAAERLAREIFPRVRSEMPEAVLRIVGADPPLTLRGAAGNGVEVTGQVPDVTPFLNEAAVFVAPLRLGGGMRVKVLEALAAGKAVVASRRAVDGLTVTDGDQVILAESDREFADAIVMLLRDPGRRRALAGRARSWAAANLGRERMAPAFEQLYRSLLQ